MAAHDTITPETIAELRRLMDAATPAPWKYVPWHVAEGPSQVRAPDGWLICELPSDALADLISQTRNVLPALLSAATRGIASAPAGDVVGWQPIETAPKDGTDILLASINQVFDGKPIEDRVTVGRWTTDEECREQIGDCGGECRCPEYTYHDPSWISWDGGFTGENPPTHWRPLPAAPQPQEGE